MPTREVGSRRLLLLSAVLIACTGISISQADVVLDGTMGSSGPLMGPDFTIPDTVGRTVGANLFHSFGEFNINSTQSATFTGPASIANVLGRVTGGSASTIDGLVRSTIPEANLYLLNPHGLIFGPNATLDVQGAFHASTSDYIGLADGTRFNAVPSAADAMLSTAPPAAFGFLSENPASISLDGSVLEVPTDETLSLIGGNITIVGDGLVGTDTLQAPGGHINIASVASTGEVIPDAVDEASDLEVDTFAHLGTIDVSGVAIINAGGDGGGTVVIRGGRLMLDSSSEVLASTRGPVGSPFLGKPGAGIDIQVTGDVVLDNGSILGTNVFTDVGEGSGGVRVRADSLEIRNGAEIQSIAFPSSAGNSGDIVVTTNRVLIRDGGFMRANTGGTGKGGTITMKTESLELLDGGLFFALAFAGSGNGGDINVDAENVLVSNTDVNSPLTGITAQTFGGTGQGGDVRITADNLRVLGGGNTVISSVTFGAGQAGDVDVSLAGDMFMSGSSANPFGTGIFANTFGTGNAGDVDLTARSIVMIDHTSVGANTFGPGDAANLSVKTGRLELREGSFFGASAIFGTGNGGSMNVTASDVLISGVSTSLDPFRTDFTGFSTTTNVGTGGNMHVIADSIHVTDKGQITSLSIGAGAAGDININLNPGPLHVTEGGTIISSALGSGNGGNIDITAAQVTLSGTGQFNNPSDTGISNITSQAGSAGNAGNVRITANRLQVLDGNIIATNTLGPGNGGNVEVNAETVLISGLNQALQEDLRAAGLDPEFARSAIRTGSNRAPSGATAVGDAGHVQIVAGNLELRDHGLITSATQTAGAGGNIDVTATNVTLAGHSTISAESTDTGNTGAITMTLADSFRSENSSVTTAAQQADGGDIIISAQRLVDLRGSDITATVNSGIGSGGNINIDPQFVVLNHSRITANAFGGPGGNIRIVAGNFIASADSVVEASSAQNIAGTVEIDSPDIDISAGISQLPKSFLDAGALLPARCGARGGQSSFVVAGRGGVALDPDGYLPSSYAGGVMKFDAAAAPQPNTPLVARMANNTGLPLREKGCLW